MQMWTHHPKGLRLDDPKLVIDPTLGKHWRLSGRMNGFRYEEVVQKFWELIDLEEKGQIIWCCLERGQFKAPGSIELIEWELNVPESKQLVFYRHQVWEDLVWTRTNDWDHLLVDRQSSGDLEGIEVVVKLPLRPEWITCHGPLKFGDHKRPKSNINELVRRSGAASGGN